MDVLHIRVIVAKVNVMAGAWNVRNGATRVQRLHAGRNGWRDDGAFLQITRYDQCRAGQLRNVFWPVVSAIKLPHRNPIANKAVATSAVMPRT